MNYELREEAAQFVYFDGVPFFMVKANGTLQWFKLSPANKEDLQEFFNVKQS